MERDPEIFAKMLRILKNYENPEIFGLERYPRGRGGLSSRDESGWAIYKKLTIKFIRKLAFFGLIQN